jgi:hypothetical protein
MCRIWSTAAEIHNPRYERRSKVRDKRVQLIDDSSIQVLVHIPKTAGSTVVGVMGRQFAPDEILSYENGLWAYNLRELPARAAAGLPGIRCLMGHIPYGLHELLGRRVEYVTMLRDPVEWTLSLYSFIRERIGKQPPDPRRLQEVAFAEVPKMTLEEFLDFLECTHTSNLQTRFLSANFDLQHPLPPYPMLPPAALNHARANLFAPRTTFGLVEHFDLSLLLFKKRLGWRHIYYRPANVTKSRIARSQLDSKTINRIRSLNSKDVQLYDAALKRFLTTIRASNLDSPQLLRRFRLTNSAYRFYRVGKHRLRRLLHSPSGTRGIAPRRQ